MLTETDKAYLAGIIDGEGTVMVCLDRKHYNSPVVTVSVGMNDREPIDLLLAAFGGCVVYIKRSNPKHKDGWRWAIKCRKAEAAIRELLPYLRIKRPQSLLALELLDCMVHVGGRVPEDLRQKQIEIRERIHLLNQRAA